MKIVRLLDYLPMERMKQDIKYVSIGMYKELEEENKNLRDYADNLDSENDNQAIEIEELKKENKKLKSDLAYERTMLDNVRAEYESLQNVNRKLKEDVDYRHHRAMVAERGWEDED